MALVVDRLIENIDKSIIEGSPPYVTYVVGNNGAGKSRMLAKICELYNSDEQSHVNAILCISNSVTDKFDFRANYKSKYLGTRSVGNAIFWSSLDREVAKQVCAGIKSGKRKYFSTIQSILGLEFFITFPRAASKKVLTSEDLAALVDKRKLKNIKISEKISLAGRRWLARAVCERIDISRVPIDRGRDLIKFLELNPAVLAEVKKGDKFLRFHDLSSGEQNRISLALKILANATPNMIVLIDEPELSLHVQWQAEFHAFLSGITEDLANYHVVIATHSPVIVSEATKGQGADTILILEKDSGVAAGNDLDSLTCEVASADSIKSFEYAVLDYFKLATFNTPSFDMKIAELMLSAAEKNESVEGEIVGLEDLLQVKNLPSETRNVIEEALGLVRKHFA